MTDDTFNTTAPAVQQTPADAATEHAVNVYLGGNPDMVKGAFDRASVAHRRAEEGSTGNDQAWRDGNEAQPLQPMGDAPAIPQTEVTAAIAMLHEKSDGHSDLVARWSADGSMSQNLAFAKLGWAELQASSPGLIAKYASLGNEPEIIEHLSRFGRQQAGMMGTLRGSEPAPMPTFIPSQNRNNSSPSVRSGSTGNNGSAETQSTLNQMLRDFPPGSEGYRTHQVRIMQLHEMLAGSGSSSIVGKNGRTA
jgi:hypothetical protein